jgi:hypothetical protein
LNGESQPSCLACHVYCPVEASRDGAHSIVPDRRRAVEAQAEGYKGTGVKACVADTGLDTTQSDIAPNFVAGYDAFDPTKPTPFNGEHTAGPLAMIS